MSGEVQSRKRKDKKRKRDEDEGAQSVPLIQAASAEPVDNVIIHVHKEAGTGGHWCARIVFFTLLAALLGVIGLIVLEHRGTIDVDTPVATSQWAMIFEGWVDDAPILKEEETDDKQAIDSNEVEDEHDNSEHDDEESETTDMKQDDDTAQSEEVKEDAEILEGIKEDDDEEECFQLYEEYVTESENRMKTISEEERDEGFSEEETEDNSGEDENENVTNEETDYSTERQIDHASAKKEEEDSAYTDDTDGNLSDENVDFENDDLDVLDELDDEENDTEEEGEAFNSDLNISIEGVKFKNDDEDLTDDFNEEDVEFVPISEIDDASNEALEEINDDEHEELINEEEIGNEDESNEILEEEEAASVSVKFGVGVALIITAHFVLVRKWKNVDADASEILTGGEFTDLSRRNTLIQPVRVEEHTSQNEQSEAQPLNKKQEQTFKELRSIYKKAGSNDKRGAGIEEIFAIKTSDLEMIFRGTTKDLKDKNNAKGRETKAELDDEYYDSEYDLEDDLESNEEDEKNNEADEGDEWENEDEEEEEEEEEEMDDEEEEQELEEEEDDYEEDETVEDDDDIVLVKISNRDLGKGNNREAFGADHGKEENQSKKIVGPKIKH